MSALLSGGVPVDAADELGRTALFFAAANGHLPVLQLLVAHGAVRGCCPGHAPQMEMRLSCSTH